MAFSCFVGAFAGRTTAGSQVVTGVGFQPLALLFFANNKSADGATASASDNPDMPMTLLGMAVSSSSRGMLATNDDFTGGNPFYSSTTCVVISENTGGNRFVADFTSMDSDGFTLNVTTAGVGFADIINYVALGGTDLTNVFIKSWASPTSTGANAQTGVGFKPDAVIVMGAQMTSAESGGFGLASGATARGSNTCNFNSSVARYQRVDKVYVEYNGGTKRLEADLTSFDSDGFTFNFSTVNATQSQLFALCLKGGQFHAGSFLQKTSTGSQGYTGVGFKPVGMLLSSVLNTASTTVNTGRISVMMGAVSGTAARATAMYGDFNDGVAGLDRTKLYKCLQDNGTPTVQASTDLTSFDTDGFTLPWGVADATAREIIYIAFGSLAGGLTTQTLTATQAQVVSLLKTAKTVRTVSQLQVVSIKHLPAVVRNVAQAMTVSMVKALATARSVTQGQLAIKATQPNTPKSSTQAQIVSCVRSPQPMRTVTQGTVVALIHGVSVVRVAVQAAVPFVIKSAHVVRVTIQDQIAAIISAKTHPTSLSTTQDQLATKLTQAQVARRAQQGQVGRTVTMPQVIRAATQDVVATLSTVKVRVSALSATQATVATLVRAVGTLRVVSQGVTVMLNNAVRVIRTSVQTQSATRLVVPQVIRAVVQAQRVTITRTGQVARLCAQATSVTITKAALVVRTVSQVTSTTITRVVAVVRTVIQAHVATLSSGRISIATLTAIQTTLAMIIKMPGRRLLATQNTQASLGPRVITRVLSALQTMRALLSVITPNRKGVLSVTVYGSYDHAFTLTASRDVAFTINGSDDDAFTVYGST